MSDDLPWCKLAARSADLQLLGGHRQWPTPIFMSGAAGVETLDGPRILDSIGV
jgi:hypothetical protein